MSKEDIAAFLDQMRSEHQEQIEAIDLPEGTLEYLEDKIRQGDSETLLFMLKLAYLMGLQTGFTVGSVEDDIPPMRTDGPIQA